MNATASPPPRLHGFKVVPKRQLAAAFSARQSGYYVLLGRRGAPAHPRESILYVHGLDRFVAECERTIEELWRKHRVVITHVAVKVGRRFGRAHDLAGAYARAVSVQQLRRQLQPRFRRV